MKIVVFSDWRVQDIEQFIDYLETLEDKPDIIIYAGDDIRRFNRVEYKFMPSKLKKRYRERFIELNESLRNLNKKALEGMIEQNEIKLKKTKNKFLRIASFSKYGLCVVAGNDDPSYIKKAIKGKNVYNIHDNPIIIENFVVIGVEGATSKIGPLLYSEKEVKAHLKSMMDQVGDKQIIIVSHSPPFGILDFAIRFGKEHIGSTSLRECIKENSDRIRLVISGHVHRQGGESIKYKDTYVVNCASHDNSYRDPGRIALIEITHDDVKTNWELLYDLESVPLVGPKRAGIFWENGITNLKQLIALDIDNELSQKISSFSLIFNYAKAIKSNEIIVKKGIKSSFDNIEEENVYFFDAEYDPQGTRYGPFGMFLLGWMSRTGEVHQLFLDNPKNESKMLKDFLQWIDMESPLFVAGFNVMPIETALPYADIILTATGCKHVILPTKENFDALKDGVILGNLGHFDIEIPTKEIYEYAKEIKPIRSDVEEIIFPDGKKIYLLAKGRLANLVLSEGHPAEVMDMSFGLQSLMSEYIVKNKDSLKPGMIEVPVEIDDRVGFLKLQSMGVKIDKLTDEQYKYIHGYEEGT